MHYLEGVITLIYKSSFSMISRVLLEPQLQPYLPSFLTTIYFITTVFTGWWVNTGPWKAVSTSPAAGCRVAVRLNAFSFSSQVEVHLLGKAFLFF